MFTAIPNDHQEIRETVASLRVLLVEQGVPIGHWFASIRWSLTRQVLRHFATQALALNDRTAGDFEERYRQHLADWTPATIDAQWPRYCRELHAILDALEKDLDADDRAIASEPPRRAAGARS